MKKLSALVLIIQMSMLISGCAFLGDVFKTGIWVGIIIVIAIVAVIAFVIKMVSK